MPEEDADDHCLGPLSGSSGVGLWVRGAVLTAHYSGAVLGVRVGMRALRGLSSRTFVLAALTCLGLGCAGVALAPSWSVFLAGVLVLGVGYGALDIGCNQLVAHSEGTSRTAVLNALNGTFGLGAVAGPILVSTVGRSPLALFYARPPALPGRVVPLGPAVSGRLPFHVWR